MAVEKSYSYNVRLNAKYDAQGVKAYGDESIKQSQRIASAEAKLEGIREDNRRKSALADRAETNRQIADERKRLQELKALRVESSKPAAASVKSDPQMDRALADIRRYKQQRVQMENELTAQVSKQAESQYQARSKQWQKGLDEFQKILKQEEKAQESSSNNSIKNSAIGSFLGNLGANVALQAVSYIKQGGEAWLDYASKIEQARIGFTSFTGSVQLADKHIRDLQKFAKETPFEFADLVEASQKMQGVGISANRVIPILKDVGNALAAAGRLGDLPNAVKALGDIQAKGKLAGQEIIQLANAGIPIREVLAKELHVSTDKIVEFGEQGRISADLVFAALHKMSEEKFGDAMQKQSRTFQGSLSNIKDALFITANKAFDPIYKKISGLSVELADEISKKGDDFTGVGELMGRYIVRGLTTILSDGVQYAVASVFGNIKDSFEGKKDVVPIGMWGTQVVGKGVADAFGYNFDVFGRNPKPTINTPYTNSKNANDDNQSYWNQRRSFNEQYTAGTKYAKAVDDRANAENDLTKLLKAAKDKTRKLTEDSSLSSILNGMRNGTMGQESGGRSGISNPHSGATGLFQVMPANVAEWTRNTLGQALTVQQFKSSSEAQIAVFNKYMGQYLEKAVKLSGGNKDTAVRMAAAAWYGGEGSMKKYDDPTPQYYKGNKYPSFREYTSSVLNKTETAMRLGNSDSVVDISKIKDELTQAYKDKSIEQLQVFSSIFKMLPTGEGANKIADLFNRQNKNSLTRNIDGSDVIEGYKNAIPANVAEPIQTKISPLIQTRLTEDEQYLKNLRESYGIEERQTKLILQQNNLKEEISIKQQDYLLSLDEETTSLQIQAALLQKRNIAQETTNQFMREQNAQFREMGDVEIALGVLRKQNADDQFVEQRRLLSAKRQQLDLEHEITDLHDQIANGGVNDALEIEASHLRDILDMRHREVEYIKDANRAELELAKSTEFSSNEFRAGILTHLAEAATLTQSLVNGTNKLIDLTVDQLNKRLGKVANIPIIGDLAKFANQSFVSKISQNLLDRFLPHDLAEQFHSTGNPQLDESKTQTKILTEIAKNTGSTSFNNITISGGAIGGGFGGGLGKSGGSSAIGQFFKAIFGGGGTSSNGTGTLGGMGPGGMMNLNNSAAPHRDSLDAIFKDIGSVLKDNPGATETEATTNKTLWGGIKNLFSTNQGGIFAKRENVLTGKDSKWGGILGGIGDIASMVAPLFGGGKLSSVIGLAGQGASFGAMFGPWGAAIGAGIGAIIGLFSGGTRKQDEQTRTKAYTDASAAFDDVISRLADHQISAADARTQGDQIISQYNQIANSLKDKKTRQIAQNEVTSSAGIIYRKNQSLNDAITVAQKYEADQKQKAIEDAANKDRSDRLIPEFASGGVIGRDDQMSEMRSLMKRRGYETFMNRPNGVVPGMFKGRDTVLAAVAPSEIVINAEQRRRMIQLSGFDIFREAAIPGYIGGGQVADELPGTLPASSLPKSYNSGNSDQSGNVQALTIENLEVHFNVQTKIDENGNERIEKIVIEKMNTAEGAQVTANNLKYIGLNGVKAK